MWHLKLYDKDLHRPHLSSLPVPLTLTVSCHNILVITQCSQFLTEIGVSNQLEPNTGTVCLRCCWTLLTSHVDMLAVITPHCQLLIWYTAFLFCIQGLQRNFLNIKFSNFQVYWQWPVVYGIDMADRDCFACEWLIPSVAAAVVALVCTVRDSVDICLIALMTPKTHCKYTRCFWCILKCGPQKDSVIYLLRIHWSLHSAVYAQVS